MFSGKTEELIRRVRRARIAGQYVEVFTPSTDTRSFGEVVSHADRKLDGVPVRVVDPDANLVRLLSDETRVVAVDEAQFFDESVVPLIRRLTDLGRKVIVAGLDLDYRGEPFGPMPLFMAAADEVLKLSAVCMRCKADATRTQRLSDDTARVLIGADKEYEARCRSCFVPPSPG